LGRGRAGNWRFFRTTELTRLVMMQAWKVGPTAETSRGKPWAARAQPKYDVALAPHQTGHTNKKTNVSQKTKQKNKQIDGR